MRISYSALDTFGQCPLKFKFQYLDKIKAPKSKEAIFGTLIHNALRFFHDPDRFVPPTEEELLAFFSQKWNPDIFDNPHEEAAAFAQGVAMLKRYFAENFGKQFNIVALETSFEVPIQIANDLHLVTGKIDRIDKNEENQFEVIDYKTTKKMPSQKNVDLDFQLSVYHLGLVNRWPSLKQENQLVKVSLYYLKHGEKLSSLRDNQRLDETQERIIKTIEEILEAQKKEKFNPLPGPLCDWCPYQRICPMFKHKFKEEKIFFNDQDISALINEYISLKDEVDQRAKRMNEIKSIFNKFMDQENMERLFSDNGQINRGLVQRFKYDSTLLREILEPLGKWENVLKIDDTQLKKTIRELPLSLRQKIEEAKKIDKEYKTFSVVRKKRK